ncbi:MAG: 2-hydroxyacyl-CoA dehydratase [Desulfobacterales bacterium]|nr:2-hydroxyacyl-CoA dehydratase [Desulfobacterales bacterium]MBF0397888.1 2-hydroxyacyl-CoA dehydratase [Desulfobacterales bacterium]
MAQIKSAKKMKEIMTTYYIEAKTAEQTGKKVAWITSGGPVEPLIVMDIIPVYPENHGAMIGASKMGADLCEKAESMGYSRDLCSYATSDISCATVNGGPIGGLPKPDMLICCNNICGTVLKWYEVQARYFNVPLFILDTPICHTEFSNEAKEYVKKQIYEYIEFLENASGKKFDYDKMIEVGKLSIKGQKLWQSVLDTTMHRPSPMSAFDAFFHLALIVTLRGTQTVVDYYQILLDEMQDRIKNNIAAVPNEKIRLLWDNLPVWFGTRWLSDKFASHNACLVADTYTSAWCSSMKYIDENNFLETMANAYTQIYLNIGIDRMADAIIDMVKKYNADGIIMHSNRSCKPYSLGQYDIQKIVQSKTNKPSLLIEADMVDQRKFSESQTESRIDAFMEMLKANY